MRNDEKLCALKFEFSGVNFRFDFSFARSRLDCGQSQSARENAKSPLLAEFPRCSDEEFSRRREPLDAAVQCCIALCKTEPNERRRIGFSIKGRVRDDRNACF